VQRAAEQRRQAFSVWMRTGRWPRRADSGAPEFKFNPWHDPRNGRFTFAGTGRYYGPGEPGSPKFQDRDAQRRDAPVHYTDGAGLPPIANMEQAEAWAASERALHGGTPGYLEAIEERLNYYRTEFARRAKEAVTPVVEFMHGIGDAAYDLAKDVGYGVVAVATTRPDRTLRNVEDWLAGTIDTWIAAEDTPAYVQADRALNWLTHASPHDLGYALGKTVGNITLAVAPEAVAAKISFARRAARMRRVEVPTDPPDVRWVDEAPMRDGPAKDYQDSVPGARSNAATKRRQVPALERTMPDGKKRLVKFDGVRGRIMIDRKWRIVRTDKAKEQALRQSEVLSQHDLVGHWEVPNEKERRYAKKLFDKLGIINIKARTVKP